MLTARWVGCEVRAVTNGGSGARTLRRFFDQCVKISSADAQLRGFQKGILFLFCFLNCRS